MVRRSGASRGVYHKYNERSAGKKKDQSAQVQRGRFYRGTGWKKIWEFMRWQTSGYVNSTDENI